MKHSDIPELDTLIPLPEALTYSATLEEGTDEQVITELMIRRACEIMHDSQQYPFRCESAPATDDTECADILHLEHCRKVRR